ncbi:hypothetical protein C8J31_11462 [Rhizobium sp. PP-CC-2G-626]|nr:hypothetical protein C8J31_11462 [Rhizobium sp. PP-CC-2G-626]
MSIVHVAAPYEVFKAEQSCPDPVTQIPRRRPSCLFILSKRQCHEVDRLILEGKRASRHRARHQGADRGDVQLGPLSVERPDTPGQVQTETPGVRAVPTSKTERMDGIVSVYLPGPTSPFANPLKKNIEKSCILTSSHAGEQFAHLRSSPADIRPTSTLANAFFQSNEQRRIRHGTETPGVRPHHDGTPFPLELSKGSFSTWRIHPPFPSVSILPSWHQAVDRKVPVQFARERDSCNSLLTTPVATTLRCRPTTDRQFSYQLINLALLCLYR